MTSRSAEYGPIARQHWLLPLLRPVLPALGVVAAVGLVYGTVKLAGQRVQPIELMSVRSIDGQLEATVPSIDQPTPSVEAPPVVAPEPAAQEPVIISEPITLPVPQPGPTFNGRPIRKVRTMSMLVTAYSPDARSCGKSADGITASGYSVWTNGMRLAAADTRLLPFGAIITVPGYNGGNPIPVLDRGGKIKGHRLDLLYATHEQALRWGTKRLAVDVWEYAD